MPPPESHHGVWLHRSFVGTLRQRGSRVTFSTHPSYAENPGHHVLGLLFEQDLSRTHTATLRLPPWFSNLLPEGALRRWIAQQAGVPRAREVELLGEIGGDLPGAVTVLPLPADAAPSASGPPPEPGAAQRPQRSADERGRFSLAGVQLKLSMVAAGDRLVVPLGGTLGDWIVKFPDATFPHLPVVEFATMELARHSGIDVPQTRLLARDELPDTPDALWAAGEVVAYAIRRFDRGPDCSLVHIEDFAQVSGAFPEDKYAGSYEALAVMVHRGEDDVSLRELVRRLAFNVLVDNSDAHLKNWSLLYTDPRRPRLSPAYDLVSVAPYPTFGGTTALSLGGSTSPAAVTVQELDRLGPQQGLPVDDLAAPVEQTIAAAVAAWPAVAEQHLAHHPGLRSAIGEVIAARARSLRS